jgi:hypothetical protein
VKEKFGEFEGKIKEFEEFQGNMKINLKNNEEIWENIREFITK